MVFIIKVVMMESVLYMTSARYMAYKSQSLPRESGPFAIEGQTNRCCDHDVRQNVYAQPVAREPLSSY